MKLANTLLKALLSCTLVIFSLGTSSLATAELSSTAVYEGGGVIWGMAWLGDQQIIATERSGTVRIIDLNNGTSQTVSGVPQVHSNGQGGLLDVAIQQPYQKGDWLYFTYSKPVEKNAATTLARAKLQENQLINWQDLLVTDSVSNTNRHYGSRIAFDKDYVFFTVGDRGHRPNSQDLTNHAGTVIRLHLDGSIPKDNPFVQMPDAKPEIWSYGHRNPQGICFDKHNNLWSSEHGPRGGDEINLIRKGKNYGWPVVSHGKEYFLPKRVGEALEKPGIESPRKVYVPSIAPGSLLCYQGDKLPSLQNRLALGALKLQHINTVAIDQSQNLSGEKRLFNNLNERIRALLESPAGDVYFSTDGGNIHKIVLTN